MARISFSLNNLYVLNARINRTAFKQNERTYLRQMAHDEAQKMCRDARILVSSSPLVAHFIILSKSVRTMD